MTAHAKLISRSAKRRLRVDAEVIAIGRDLEREVEQAWSVLMDAIPDDPKIHATGRIGSRIDAIAAILGRKLVAKTQALLLLLAKRQHFITARLLTRRIGRSRKREDDAQPLFNYEDLILDPPTLQDLIAVVGPAPQKLSSVVNTSVLTSTVFRGISQGDDRREIAKSLQPLFNGYAVAARRLARTEGLRVATATTLQASEQLADDIIGYEIQAVLDDRTRPDHRERNGTIYYRQPTVGQLGFGDMPRPPFDAPGVIAWNCRCFLVPVFRE